MEESGGGCGFRSFGGFDDCGSDVESAYSGYESGAPSEPQQSTHDRRTSSDRLVKDCEDVTKHVPGIIALSPGVLVGLRKVWLCMSFRRIGLGSERAIALGLDPKYPWIAIQIQFSDAYETDLHSETQPMIAEDTILQTKDPSKLTGWSSSASCVGLGEYHCRCSLAGLLAHRLGIFLSGRLRDAADSDLDSPVAPVAACLAATEGSGGGAGHGLRQPSDPPAGAHARAARGVPWLELLFGVPSGSKKSISRETGQLPQARAGEDREAMEGRDVDAMLGLAGAPVPCEPAGFSSSTRVPCATMKRPRAVVRTVPAGAARTVLADSRRFTGFDGDLSAVLRGCAHSHMLWPPVLASQQGDPEDLEGDILAQQAAGVPVGFSYAVAHDPEPQAAAGPVTRPPAAEVASAAPHAAGVDYSFSAARTQIRVGLPGSMDAGMTWTGSTAPASTPVPQVLEEPPASVSVDQTTFALSYVYPDVPDSIISAVVQNCDGDRDTAERVLRSPEQLHAVTLALGMDTEREDVAPEGSTDGVELPSGLTAICFTGGCGIKSDRSKSTDPDSPVSAATGAVAEATPVQPSISAGMASAVQSHDKADLVLQAIGGLEAVPGLTRESIMAALDGVPAETPGDLVRQILGGTFTAPPSAQIAQAAVDLGAPDGRTAGDTTATAGSAAQLPQPTSASTSFLSSSSSSAPESTESQHPTVELSPPSPHLEVSPKLLRDQMEPYLSTWNPLISVILFVEAVLKSAHRCCLCCGKPLKLAGMKPTICGSSLCTHRYANLGLGMQLDAFILQQPQAVDLLVTLFYAFLARSGRRELRWDADVMARILEYSEGYVQVAERQAMKDAASSPQFERFAASNVSAEAAGGGGGGAGASAESAEDKIISEQSQAALQKQHILREKQRLEAVRALPTERAAYALRMALEQCSSIGYLQLVAKRGGLKGLLKHLDDKDRLLVPIFRMLLADTPAHIRGLTLGGSREEQLPGCSRCWTFVFKAGELSKEAEFQQMRSVNGSFFAFHGSQTSNWHIILKTGLRVLSHTRYMSFGAVRGAGIYFARNSKISLPYAKCGYIWGKSMFGQLPAQYMRRPDAAVPGGPSLPNEASAEGRKAMVAMIQMHEQAARVYPPSRWTATSKIVALCELIPGRLGCKDYAQDTQRWPSIGRSSAIHVLKNESMVVTRYLILNASMVSLDPADAVTEEKVRALTNRMVAKVDG